MGNVPPRGTQRFLLMLLATAVPCVASGQVVHGTVIDPAVGVPVAEALVVMVNEDGERVVTVFTTEEGGFRLEVPTDGAYMLGVARLGYQQAITPQFEVTGQDIRLDIHLPASPVAVDELTVESSRNTPDAGRLRGLLPDERRAGTLMGRLSRVEIDALAPQTDMVGLLQRMNVPGLRARRMPLSIGGPDNALCVEAGRNRSVLGKTASAILSPAQQDARTNPNGTSLGNECQMAAIYVDGHYISDPGDVLASLSPRDLELVELLAPLEALARFGARAANGALMVWTRRGN